MAVDGLTTIPSAYGAKETADRLEAEIRGQGVAVFARIDHAAGAAQADLALRPRAHIRQRQGRHAAHAGQSGIDLPLKALVCRTRAHGLSYNEPSWIVRRHGLTAATKATVDAIAHGLGDLARKAHRYERWSRPIHSPEACGPKAL